MANNIILFDEEINVVEIQYEGVNAALLADINVRLTNLEAAFDAAIGGVDGQLGTLADDVASLQSLYTVQVAALNDEVTARQLSDLNLNEDIAGQLLDIINDYTTDITNEANTRAAAILAEASARGAAIASSQAIIIADNAILATSVSGMAVELAAATASIIEVEDALVTETTARISQYDVMQAQFDNNSGAIIDESVLRADADAVIASTVTALTATVATKTKTYLQTTAPASGMVAGDLWFDSDDSNKAYRYSGSSWVLVVDPASGNTSYFQTTAPASGMIVGDIWFDSDDNNKMYRYDGSSWVAVDDARIATNTAAIITEASARATGDSAVASTVTALTAVVGTKNITFRQTTAPSSGMVAGDLWFDTDDANKIYRYTGSGWGATDDDRIATNAAAVITEASARVTADGVIEAKYTVKVDVNGHIAGYGLIATANNGTPTSEFIVSATTFKVYNGTTPIAPFFVTGGVVYMQDVVITNALIENLTIGKLTTGTLNADMLIGTGRIIWSNGSYMKVTGVGFGSSNQFIDWYGPYFASLSSCTEANAIQYLKTNGSAYFGGALSAGVLKNAATTTNTTSTAFIEVGPFLTNGGSKSIVVSYTYMISTHSP